MLPVRKTPHLRFRRITVPGTTYFITFATKHRRRILTTPATGQIFADSLSDLHSSNDIDLLAATIMPDHVHLLFTLGERLRVGQIMGKLKSMSCDHDRDHWRWQADGFEHQLRPHETIEDYGFYIFMNPYRAALCPLNVQWPWWINPNPAAFRFLATLTGGPAVPAAWLAESDRIAKKISASERPDRQDTAIE